MKTKRPKQVSLIAPVLDAMTFKKENDNQRSPRSFHASSIEDCGRKQWYGLQGYESDPRTNHPEYIRDAAAGNAIHEQYQNLLLESGLVVKTEDFFRHVNWSAELYDSDVPDFCIELPLPPNEFQIGGRIDAIVEVNGHYIILDIKSVKDKAYNELPSGYKYKKFYAQMQVYMHITGITQALIVVVDRNDSMMKEFVIEYDREWCLDQFKRIAELKFMLDNNILPDAEPSWGQCSFCGFTALCAANIGGKQDG